MSLERMDSREFESLGIRFKTEIEANAFGELMKKELIARTRNELMISLSFEQMNEYDRIDDQDDFNDWINDNCPDYWDTVRRKMRELEQEIICYKSMISGAVLD